MLSMKRKSKAMEGVVMEVEKPYEVSPVPLSFARNYQLEALESAIKQNTIVFLETGSGKTLIAIMLLRSYAYLLRKPSDSIAVFLVPQVVLVAQQAAAVEMHTDLKVGTYWGEKGVDNWDEDMWKEEIEKYEVLVMTPQILLDNLRHSFMKLSMIKVLILDECHHARGNHPYACIMSEFYHRQLSTCETNLPRVLGMTASPIKSKGGSSTYWKHISELETLMNSKVYTCVSESVLAEFIPFSTPKFKFYKHEEIPYSFYPLVVEQMKSLLEKHEQSLIKLELEESAAESISKKLTRFSNALLYCLYELGIWLTMKAAESFSCNEIEYFPWGQVDVFGEPLVKKFCSDAFKELLTYIPTNLNWSISDDAKKTDMDNGLLTAKVLCLIDLLLEYRDTKDLRCIIFVERIVAAVAIQSLLSAFLPKYINWKVEYIAGAGAGTSNQMQHQSRKKQDELVGEFREGKVNILVATSILEEGLDVQSCNLVVRFDPSSTVCSFIQSRGRARKQNSDYVLMVKSGDIKTQNRLEEYLASGEMMRRESLKNSSLPCIPLESKLEDGSFYCVESTGAIVTLASSISLIYFYCSRLPADGYFKPTPRWDATTGTLHLPKSCPIQVVSAVGNKKVLKQIACLDACKQLHQLGFLTDKLVPDMVVEEDCVKELASQHYEDDQPNYVPSELVGSFGPTENNNIYHCYFIELIQDFEYAVPIQNLILGMSSELESDIANAHFKLRANRGSIRVALKYAGHMNLNENQVMLSRRFQVTLLKVLLDHKFDKLGEFLNRIHQSERVEKDYLLLPAANPNRRPMLIDWDIVVSALFPVREFKANHEISHKVCLLPKSHSNYVHSQNGIVCTCVLKNSMVYTPHNGHVYCITGVLNDMNANSRLECRSGQVLTYKKYFNGKYKIDLQFSNEPLLRGHKMFQVKNCLLCRDGKIKESTNCSVELPPELCYVIMAPISLSTVYSFSFFPSIMHRLESLLLAANLKRMLFDTSIQDVTIPTTKVLEAITAKKCQEEIHFESLETLGDSFLKYAASQHLYKTYQNNHEGLLSIKKEKIISNAALTKRGIEHKLPGFIRHVCFNPKDWTIPGDTSISTPLQEVLLPNMRKVYISGTRKLKSKRVADVVESLIGAFLSTGGEISALKFMDSIGIEVDFSFVPYERHFNVQPERLVNIGRIQSLLNNYLFRDPCLLVEALTHGSYMLPEIPTCYQRLEFLGDAVLDYAITVFLYNKYPELSPGMLTNLRSASVNNDCYALAATKAGLYKHILHMSHQLHKEIKTTVSEFEKLSLESTFGWETESSYPKALGDVIESLAGAIFVDSGYNKDIVFESIRPLLEPLVTPQTLKLHPVQELTELCQKMNYNIEKLKNFKNGVKSFTVKVLAEGNTYEHTSEIKDKSVARKVACKEALKLLKEALNLP